MPYPTSGLYPDSWYPSLADTPPDEAFDPTTPTLATYTSAAILATYTTAATLVTFESSPEFAVGMSGLYGGGSYSDGLYGEGGGVDGGQFDITDAALATLLTSPAMASYDTPEPAL